MAQIRLSHFYFSISKDQTPCMNCLLIEMGEMACYQERCPQCGKIPPGGKALPGKTTNKERRVKAGKTKMPGQQQNILRATDDSSVPLRQDKCDLVAVPRNYCYNGQRNNGKKSFLGPRLVDSIV